MRKRFAALFTAAVLALFVFPISALADGEDTKLIAFTFDDGPNRYTSRLLDGLEERGVVATFFMNGRNGGGGAVNYPGLLARMRDDGDQLANHTYSHASFSRLSSSGMEEEVAGVEELLFSAMGGSYRDCVRTPGGAVNSTVRASVDAPIILWSVDTMDWKYRSADSAYRRAVSGAKDGAIVLMHDLYSTSVDGALMAIDELKSEGYEFVTVAELMRRRGVELTAGEVYTSAPSGATLPAYSAPVLSRASDDAAAAASVTFSSPDGVPLYYTMDGTLPTLASAKYEGPIEITGGSYFTVAGIDAWGTRTPAASMTAAGYTVRAPEASVSGGMVSLSCGTAGASVYYTLDGSDPSVSGILYTAPFRPAASTVKCAAFLDGRAPSATSVYTLTEYGDLFSDVPAAAWYYGAVGTAVHEGSMTGSGGRFCPDGDTTRAMLVTALWRASGSPAADGGRTFSDVPAGSWYEPAVRWAVKNGVADGVGGDMFSPDSPVTRQDMAVFLSRCAAVNGAGSSGTSKLSAFSDAADVSGYAADAVGWCLKNGLLNGEGGALSPKAKASRAQCAAVVTRMEKLSRGRGKTRMLTAPYGLSLRSSAGIGVFPLPFQRGGLPPFKVVK